MKYSIDALDTISVFLVSILMVIIVVGIINTMLISVRERTSEIGSLRAIGMHRWEVLMMIMLRPWFGALCHIGGALVGAGTASALDLFEIALPKGAVQTVLMSDTLHLDIHSDKCLDRYSHSHSSLYWRLCGLRSVLPNSNQSKRFIRPKEVLRVDSNNAHLRHLTQYA